MWPHRAYNIRACLATQYRPAARTAAVPGPFAKLVYKQRALAANAARNSPLGSDQ